MNKLTSLTGAVVALVATTALLAGCGAGDDDVPKLAQNHELTGEAIRIGTICTCSGPLPQPLFEKTMRAWESWTNANDGVNGHPVEVLIEDDGNDPAKALQAAKRLVEEEKVMAIVGEVSQADAGWADYVESQGIPVVGGHVYSPPFISSENFFASGSSLPVMTVGMLEQAEKAGADTLGVMYCAETPVCAQLVDLAKLSATVVGSDIDIVGAPVSASAARYNADCLKLRNAGVDVLSVLSNTQTVIRVGSECAKVGWTPTQVNQAGEYSSPMLADPTFEGFNITGPVSNFYDTAVPGVKEYQEGLEKADPSILTSPDFGYQNIYPWLGGQLFKAAAEAGDLDATSTPADVMDALYSLKDETLDGLVPPLNFVKGDKAASLTPCYFVQEIRDGELRTVGGGEPVCMSDEQRATLWSAVLAGG